MDMSFVFVALSKWKVERGRGQQSRLYTQNSGMYNLPPPPPQSTCIHMPALL